MVDSDSNVVCAEPGAEDTGKRAIRPDPLAVAMTLRQSMRQERVSLAKGP